MYVAPIGITTHKFGLPTVPPPPVLNAELNTDVTPNESTFNTKALEVEKAFVSATIIGLPVLFVYVVA
jgi:hypothetical protein